MVLARPVHVSAGSHELAGDACTEDSETDGLFSHQHAGHIPEWQPSVSVHGSDVTVDLHMDERRANIRDGRDRDRKPSSGVLAFADSTTT